MDRTAEHLRNSHSVLLASHTSPDGDAIGSLIAMGLCLKALGKDATLYNQSPIPTVYRYLPSVSGIQNRVDDPERFETAVILDCGDLDRVGDLAGAIGRIPDVVNIDHHVTNTRFGRFRLIDPTACATAEIVYRLIRRMEIPMVRAIATAIYTGIFTDTGSFRFSNTNRAAFSICEEMVSAGVDPYEVARHVYGTYSLGRIKLLNRALDSLEISDNGKLSLMTLTREMFEETGTRSEDGDGLINYARFIEDVRIAVLIREYTNGEAASVGAVTGRGVNRFHVSLRSDGSVDVGAIAAMFGGGGHRNAAGFNIVTGIGELKSGIFNLAERV